jgi:hypothetical protein
MFINNIKRLFLLLVMLTSAPGILIAGQARDDVVPIIGKPGKPRLGIAVTPMNFPNHSGQDLDNAYKKAASLGQSTVFIMQWSRFNLAAAKLTMKKNRENGLLSVLGLSPTVLTGMRNSLDVPENVRKAAGNNLSFANPIVQQSYIDAAVELAKLKPDYLCLATEINLLAIGNIREYLLYSLVYRKAYEAIRRISPGTRTFVSFQWDIMRLIDTREPNRLHEHGKLIDVFRPSLDLIALTSYPSSHFDSPDLIPKDYYSQIYRHVDRSEPILVMELGWPSSGAGSESEQAGFIQRLPALFRGMRVELIAWSLLHDVNLAEFDDNLNKTGLIHSNGTPKPALREFINLQ